MLHSAKEFDNVHLHAAAIGTWNQTYTQLSAGRLDSSLHQLQNSRSHVFRERINQRVVQHGETPQDRICFALPIALSGAAHLQGREISAPSLLFLRGGEEFMFHAPMHMDMLALTFERQLFEEHLDRTTGADKIWKLLKQPVIKVPPARFLACRDQLLALFAQAFAQVPPPTAAHAEDRLTAVLLDELVNLLLDRECDSAQRQPSTTHSYIVDKLHRLTLIDANNSPSIMEASKRLQVSRRTVQNSFRSVAGTTPVNYLRSVRLNGTRRDLMRTAPDQACIAEIAARWGFFHMSHFAEDYFALFHELPSQTLRAALSGQFGRHH